MADFVGFGTLLVLNGAWGTGIQGTHMDWQRTPQCAQQQVKARHPSHSEQDSSKRPAVCASGEHGWKSRDQKPKQPWK